MSAKDCGGIQSEGIKMFAEWFRERAKRRHDRQFERGYSWAMWCAYHERQPLEYISEQTYRDGHDVDAFDEGVLVALSSVRMDYRYNDEEDRIL